MLPLTSRPAVGFLDSWGKHPAAPAVLTADGAVTYGELDALVGQVEQRLGGTRLLVLVAADNTLDALTGYLGALRGGHVAMLVPPRADRAELLRTYAPDVVMSRGDDGDWMLDERTLGTAHELHPDLALLLMTSGSTGSAKLVRLSYDNLASNAAAIAGYLGLTADDRAPTALPMSYCYGLSVVHSHLAVGAALVLTDLSVTDPCFWDLVERHGATGLPGVPYTFRMLDRIGFDRMSLPSLRYVTQAGGALGPEEVRRWAGVGRQQGWDLFVMYGQTEATARMAYLPPDLAEKHPTAIGRAIDGGSLDVDDDGELVYRGPNVMLGYASCPDDLARGREVTELRTGDLARRNGAGLIEVTGRRNRFVKVFGLRLDLDHLERSLHDDGIEVACTGDDDGLVVGVVGPGTGAGVAQRIAARTGLPLSAVSVHELEELPRTAAGKLDYQRLKRPVAAPAVTPRTVHELYRELLGVPAVADDDTFVSLGGDSLSFVEASLRLEDLLGALPPDWHLRPVTDLQALVVGGRRRATAQVETSVLLRALGILLVTAHHVGAMPWMGGAHILLAVAGHSFARFQLSAARTSDRASGLFTAAKRVALPSAAYIVVVCLLRWDNQLTGVMALGDNGRQWYYWYVEALVEILVVLALLLSFRRVRALERRWSFGFALAVLAVGLSLRYHVVPIPRLTFEHARAQTALWVFALGWAAERASRPWRRLLMSVVTVVGLHGYFVVEARGRLVTAGVLLLIWVPVVRVLKPLHRAIGLLAAASLWIYLTQRHVYPTVGHYLPDWLTLGVTLLVGVATWWVVDRFTAAAPRGAARQLRARTLIRHRRHS